MVTTPIDANEDQAVVPGGGVERPAGGFAHPDHTSGVKRDPPEPDDSRRALVKELIWKVKKAKARWKDDFKRMREDMVLAYEGAAEEWANKGFYVANIVQSHVRTKVGDLYAKNPKAEWQRRPRMDFALWDGSMQQLMGAMMLGAMGEPNSMQVLMDYQQGMATKRMMEKLGTTLELLFEYFTDEQTPNFKAQMKQSVRRTITTGVGYVSSGYKRVGDHTPEQRLRLADMNARLAHLQRISQDIEDKIIDPASASEMEELKLQLADLRMRPELILREGLAWDYPQSTRIIIDSACRQLMVGFPGADWLAEEFILPTEEVQEIYGVDVKKDFMPYTVDGKSGAEGIDDAVFGSKNREEARRKGMCMVWIMQNRKHGFEYHLLDGYKDFLKEPQAPEFEVEGFFRVVPIVFNQIEHESRLFPYSDVYLLRHPQAELNRSRQMLREHRRANRPKHAVAKGALTPDDLAKLTTHPANAVLEIEGMTPGDKIADLLQAVPNAPIDPNVYETAPVFDDFQRVGGSQEANLGGTGGDTATESTIAESTRMSSVRSNTDDLDDALAAIARHAGQILLQAMPKQEVIRIVGPGAVWPEWTAREIMEEISLTVRAGSSGRPNKAQDLQNWERILPFLMQIPGVSPEWILKETLRRTDDTMDMNEALKPDMPSIQGMNSMKGIAGPGAGAGAPPDKQPGAQGPKGSANGPQPGPASPEAAGQTGPNLNAIMGQMLQGGGGPLMGGQPPM